MPPAHLRLETDGAARLQLTPQPLHGLAVNQDLKDGQPQRTAACCSCSCTAACCSCCCTAACCSCSVSICTFLAVTAAAGSHGLLGLALVELEEDAVTRLWLGSGARQHVLLSNGRRHVCNTVSNKQYRHVCIKLGTTFGLRHCNQQVLVRWDAARYRAAHVRLQRNGPSGPVLCSGRSSQAGACVSRQQHFVRLVV